MFVIPLGFDYDKPLVLNKCLAPIRRHAITLLYDDILKNLDGNFTSLQFSTGNQIAAQLSCHVRNFVAIALLGPRGKQNEIPFAIALR